MDSKNKCATCVKKYCHSCRVIQRIAEKHESLKTRFGDDYDNEIVRRNEEDGSVEE